MVARVWSALLLSVAVFGHLVGATPSLWIGNHLDVTGSTLKCTDHPEGGWGQHPGPATLTDPSITFSMSSIAGFVTSVCSGTYTLQANLAKAGHVFITASAGSMSPGNKCADGSGTRYGSPGMASTWTQSLAITCADLAGKTELRVRLTYATGTGAAFTTNFASFPVAADCLATTCNQPPPPPTSTSPSPSPPPVAPSPPPTTTPVYPTCFGAKALPDPVPVGKRCFYDKECKVQCEDLTSPNCQNAAPLPCPVPSGKCCFYDSQCKPQCEDKGDSRCAKLPPCNVVGCSQCSATDASVCVACNAGKGFALNVASNKCDCLPGWGTSSTSGCTKCASGSIGYGGKIGSSTCKPCPAGRQPNPEGSECVVPGAWEHWGMDLTNRRFGYAEKTINYTNAGSLAARWTVSTGSDVSATPTIVGDRLYVPDWSGNLYALVAATGEVVWQKKVLDYILSFEPAAALYPAGFSATNIISRTSPAVDGGRLVIGVMKKGGGFPYLLCISTADGSLIWGKRVDPHPAAMVTQSPTISNGFIFVGVSSLEELWANSAAYPCCTFRGNMLKVSLADGAILWRTYMTPDNDGQTGGFSGNSVWGSSPAVDVARNQVYIATGNNYDIPDQLAECIRAVGTLTPDNMAQALACEAAYPTNYHNSMLALDLDTGAVKWVKQLGGPDAWNAACFYGGNAASCPDINSPDYDFAQAPMLVTACKGCKCKQLVVAGQKSGWLWALSPDTGAVHWSLPVGPGGTVGGLQWGSAADQSRIYVANNNYLQIDTDLTNLKTVQNIQSPLNLPKPTSTAGGLAGAVDAYDGSIAWTFANPTAHWGDVQAGTPTPARSARSQAPMTVANGVVYYPSMDLAGTVFFLKADTGKLLGSFQTGQTVGCGPSVVNGKVFIGSGYANFGLGLTGNKLYMLSP